MSDISTPPPIVITSPSATFSKVTINPGGSINVQVASQVKIAELVKPVAGAAGTAGGHHAKS